MFLYEREREKKREREGGELQRWTGYPHHISLKVIVYHSRLLCDIIKRQSPRISINVPGQKKRSSFSE